MSSRFLARLRGDAEEVDSEEEGVEFAPDSVRTILIPEFEAEAFYFEADEREGYRNNHEMALQMNPNIRPTLRSLVNTCTWKRREPTVLFEQGMWVEFLSDDMEWKVGVVNRVIRQAPDDWDFDEMGGEPPVNKMEIYYNVGLEGVVSKDAIRAPYAGLKRIFGQRPWLLQQFMLLQLEKRIRFDENHEYDFEEIDNLEFASIRYDLWLNDNDNGDFKEYHDKQPLVAQQLLKSHILTPFNLMDFIVEKPDEWDFDDEDISVYTYLGVIGSGIPITTLTFIVQILSPLILLYNNILLSDGERNERFFEDFDSFVPSTTFELFCTSPEGFPNPEGKVLIVLVVFIYLTTVVPDSWLSFYRTSGGASSTYSKINSLRNIVWKQNDDSLTQILGFKADRLMNTGYISFLYTLMLFILLQTPVALDLILNALAFEFIHDFDERIANSDWWDENNRWIKAGTIELVMQGTLRLRVLESPTAICSKFDIDPAEYRQVLGSKSLKDAETAAKDEANPKFMTRKERIFAEVAQKAKDARIRFTVDEYEKQVVQFGFFGGLWAKLGLRNQGVFHRYSSYRTWSRWEDILFLPKVPTFDHDKSSALLVNKKAVKVKLGRSGTREFFDHVLSVISGYDLVVAVWRAGKLGNWRQVPVKFFLGIFEIIFYLLQIFFPGIVIAALVFLPYCY